MAALNGIEMAYAVVGGGTTNVHDLLRAADNAESRVSALGLARSRALRPPVVVMSLLAVDLGLRTGLAVFGTDGRLQTYHSQHFGGLTPLKRAAPRRVWELPELTHLVLEGDARLAEIWSRPARRRGVRVLHITPETWRHALLLDRQQRTGRAAKEHAGVLARRVIVWSGCKAPTSLRHDAAEAILIGLFGVLKVGWLPSVPDAIQPG